MVKIVSKIGLASKMYCETLHLCERLYKVIGQNFYYHVKTKILKMLLTFSKQNEK